jgi:hypothetical protein
MDRIIARKRGFWQGETGALWCGVHFSWNEPVGVATPAGGFGGVWVRALAFEGVRSKNRGAMDGGDFKPAGLFIRRMVDDEE